MNSTEMKITDAAKPVEKDAPQGGAIVEPEPDALKAFNKEAAERLKERQLERAELEKGSAIIDDPTHQ